MKHLTLKQKILLSVALALALVVTLLSWLGYSSQRDMQMASSLEQIRQISRLRSDSISEWLDIRQKIVGGMANKLPDNMLSVLQQGQTSGQFQLTFFGDSNGQMHDSDPNVDRTGFDPRTRTWYQGAISNNGPFLTKPYMDQAYHELVVTLAQPAPGGVTGGAIKIKTLVDGVNQMSLLGDGFAILMHKDGTLIATPHKTDEMVQVNQIDSALDTGLLSRLAGSNSSDRQFEEVYFATQGRDKLVWADNIPKTDWQLVMVLDKASLHAPLFALLQKQVGMALVILLVSLVAIAWLTNLLLGPLGKVSQALARIADGSGDLTQRIKIEAHDEVGQLAASFNRFVDSQHKLISTIRTLAGALNTDAEHGLENNREAVSALTCQQQDVTMVATAVTEMASATQEISGNAEQTAAAAQQSTVSCEQGKNLVNKTRQSINHLAGEVAQATNVIGELSRHAQAISSILSTIQGIAEQTNLLALNAAIEAARAGEQGRGFAVVADEVRVLSKRTQDSTGEIHRTIETLQKTTAHAVTLMQSSQTLAGNSVQDADDAAAALEEITIAVSLISDMANQIATAAEEQTQVTAEITRNTTAIKDVSDGITIVANRELEQANLLKQRSTQLNHEVMTFIL
jgi:methyl-accepting chemotaxis protein